jgi:hypothetical protein
VSKVLSAQALVFRRNRVVLLLLTRLLQYENQCH